MITVQQSREREIYDTRVMRTKVSITEVRDIFLNNIKMHSQDLTSFVVPNIASTKIWMDFFEENFNPGKNGAKY